MIVYRIAIDPWADKLSFRYNGRDEVSRDVVVVVVVVVLCSLIIMKIMAPILDKSSGRGTGNVEPVRNTIKWYKNA